MCRELGRDPATEPPPRFVTASLNVDYLKPTPIEVSLEAQGRIIEVKPRKVVVAVEVRANGELCARGQVIAVLMPESMLPKGRPAA